jgi:hypothetical protein
VKNIHGKATKGRRTFWINERSVSARIGFHRHMWMWHFDRDRLLKLLMKCELSGTRTLKHLFDI